MPIETDEMIDTIDTMTSNEVTNLSQKITQLLNAVFYASNEAMVLLDHEASILILNPEAENVFACKDSAVRGQSFTQFIPSQNKEKFRSLLQHFSLTSSEGSTPIDKLEIACQRYDGHLIPLEISLSVINIDSEIFFIANCADIAHKKRTEVEISMLAHAMKSISEALAILDLNGNVIFTNEALSKMVGYSAQEFKNQHISILCTPDERSRFNEEIIPATLKGNWEGDILFEKKSGQSFPFSFTTSTINDEESNPILIIFVGRDTSEKKYLEEQLRQAQKMEAIGQLAGGVAHDFNNLLIVITGYSQTLLNNFGEDSVHYKNLFQINKAAERAASLTRQLLAFSRKQVLQPKVIELNDLINDMEKMLNRLIGETIKLETSLQESLPKVFADSGQIEQVIMNLVVNARDAMPNGGKLMLSTQNVFIDEKERLNYNNAPAGEYIMLSLNDTGVGMSEETLSHIFEPFYTTKDQGKGTGLGLSTVYGIIEQSGYYISVTSIVNEGTTFKIIIPHTLESEEEVQEETRVENDQIHGSETILVVEDEEQVRELVIEMLETYGYNVLSADNGLKAIDVYNTHRDSIRLILTDVVMPEMGGKKLIDSLENFKEGTQIIFMSGYTDNAIDDQGILAPNIEFIQKPFSPLDLLKKVRTVLSD